MWKMVQDLFRLDIVKHMLDNHMMEYVRRDEMLKIALATMGQAKASVIRKNPASAARVSTLCRLRRLARCHSLRDRFLSGSFSGAGHITKDFV